MTQEFYVDNLISRFIKCLLFDNYVPTVDVWRPGKNIVNGFTYITQDKYIVKAKHDYPTSDSGYTEPKSALDSRYFEIVDNFIPNKFYRGITTNFESNSALYDPSTHYMLGQYLRYIRDMNNLNLMPYYNCYSGESSDKIRIDLDTSKVKLNNEIEDGLISYIVPIKFNQKYSIYYSSDVPFYILPIYYNDINAWNVTTSNGILKKIQVNSCSINKPFILDTIKVFGDNNIFNNSTSKMLEDYLALLIQVPKNDKSNLLVLEGDYSNIKLNLNTTNKGFKELSYLPQVFLGNTEDKDNSIFLTESELDDIFKPYPSLSQNISNNNYAFSDRLVEYLLLSPIINKDLIRYNIKRVQEYISSNKAKEDIGNKYDISYVSDIWDNNMRYYIYNLISQYSKKSIYKDINGFVDKDSEFIIDMGKSSGGSWNV